MDPLLLGLLVVGGALVLGWGAVRAIGAARDHANTVVPGVDTGAPRAWAGAHDPLARLHRRLVEASETARETVPGGAADQLLGPTRAAVEDEAVAVDRSLVAIARLPEGPDRDELVATATARVEAVEAAAAELVRARVESGTTGTAAVDAALERSRLLDEARAEVEAVERRATGATDPPGAAPDADEDEQEPPPEPTLGTG